MCWDDYRCHYFRGQTIIIEDKTKDDFYNYQINNISDHNIDYITYSNNKNTIAEITNKLNFFHYASVPIVRFFNYTSYCLLGFLKTKFEDVDYIDLDAVLIKTNNERSFSKETDVLDDSKFIHILYDEIDKKIFNCSYVFFSMLEWMRLDVNKTSVNLKIINYINKKYKNIPVFVRWYKRAL